MQPSAGDVLTQPADGSVYGSVLAPGSYASVGLHGVGTVCFDISADRRPVSAVGVFDAVVSGTGVTGR